MGSLRLGWRLFGKVCAPFIACALWGTADADPATMEPPVEHQQQSPAEARHSPHESVSRMLEGILRRADSLLSGDRTYDAPTGSYLQLGGGWTFRREPDGGVEALVITRAKINLPHTNEKVQLLIDRDINNVFRSSSDRAAATAAGQTAPDDSAFVGLRGIAQETLKVRLTADVGVRPHGITPDPYVRGRAERIFGLGAWEVPLSETLLWRRSEDSSATTQLGLLRSLHPDTVLGIVSTATWRDRSNAFDLSEVASITHRIADRALAGVELGVYGRTDPSWRATAYSVALRYRRRIHSDWLLLEVRPQLIYPEGNGFRPVPSLTVSLEMFFGLAHYPLP